jgi:uncharacterized iron-regulated membrane protein
VENLLLGVVSVVAGVVLIARRKQFAAATVRQQNKIWRTNYGPRQVRHNERAAVVVGLFSFALALMFWFT